MKKNTCTPINPKKYSCYGLKKIHTRNLITKKDSCGSRIPHPHHNFCNGPSLTRIWYTGRIRRELLLKSTITGVPTTLTPYPFPSMFFLLTSLIFQYALCTVHTRLPRVRTNFLPVQPVQRERANSLTDCSTVCSSKTSRFHGSHVKNRRIGAIF